MTLPTLDSQALTAIQVKPDDASPPPRRIFGRLPLFILVIVVFIVANVLLALRVADADRALSERYGEALRLSLLAIDAQGAAARVRQAHMRLTAQANGTTTSGAGAAALSVQELAQLRAALDELTEATRTLRSQSVDAPIEQTLSRLDAQTSAMRGPPDAAPQGAANERPSAASAASPAQAPSTMDQLAASAQRLEAVERETAALVIALRERSAARASAANDGARSSRLTLLAVGVMTLLAGLAAAAMAWRTANEHRLLVGRLGQLVHEDGLTRVVNRRGLDELLPIEVGRARRVGSSLTAVMIDLDHFKRYNDRRGHAAGDALLRAAAQSWRRQLRPTDVVARYGGEEFTLVLPSCDSEQAVVLIDRLRPLMPEAQTFSAGVATWDGFESAHDLVARADKALLQAKKSGRNRTVIAAVEAQMTLPFKAA